MLGYILLAAIKTLLSRTKFNRERSTALVLLKGVLQICNDLNKKVVLEGVETQEQVDLLTQYEVDVAQGFFYTNPNNYVITYTC